MGGHSPLSVKVGEKVDQVEVLEQERTIETGPLNGVWVRYGYAVRRGVHTEQRNQKSA